MARSTPEILQFLALGVKISFLRKYLKWNIKYFEIIKSLYRENEENFFQNRSMVLPDVSQTTTVRTVLPARGKE